MVDLTMTVTGNRASCVLHSSMHCYKDPAQKGHGVLYTCYIQAVVYPAFRWSLQDGMIRKTE